MKFVINNNNTTYNYSYYATRPKWLTEALPKKRLSQKKFDLLESPLCSKKPFPTHKIAFAPWSETGLSSIQFKSEVFSRKVRSKRVKTSAQKVYQHLFQTKELLCWTSDLSFFNLRGYFSNILKVLQVCRFAVRNNKKILFIKGNHSNYGQGKRLNPWLVQYERNTVPITLSNLFNKCYLNPTQSLQSPQIFCLKKNKEEYQEKKGYLKVDNAVKHSNRVIRKSTPKNKQKNQTSCYYRSYYQLNALLKSSFGLNFEDNSGHKTSHFKNQKTSSKPSSKTGVSKESLLVQLNPPQVPSILDQGAKQSNKKGAFLNKEFNWTKAKSEQKKTRLLLSPYLKGQTEIFQEQSPKKNNKYERPFKVVTIKMDNIAKLWIKEAQTISQQTAAGLTTPLAGFLTNSKTTFNTVYNLSNYDFYNSANLKPNSLFNREPCQIKTYRLENTHFEKKSDHLFPLVFKARVAKQSIEKSTKNNDSLFLRAKTKSKNRLSTGEPTKSIKHEINPEQIYKKQVNHLERLAFSFPKVFGRSQLTAAFKKDIKRGKKTRLTQYEAKRIDTVFLSPPKDQRELQLPHDFGQKGWWIDYSSTHNYLPLTPDTGHNVFFKNGETMGNEKTKNAKPLEYCFFGDVLTWQSKCQKSSSMFFSEKETPKNRENIIAYLKKQVILEKRRSIVLKKKNPSFFTRFKTRKIPQAFKNRTPRLEDSLKSFAYGSKRKQRQTKNSFLKKRQFLSTLGRFIVFYFNGPNRLFKNQARKTKQNQTHIRLPSFPIIKKKIKIALNFKNFHQYGYKPIYGYSLALHVPGRAFSRFYDRVKPHGRITKSPRLFTTLFEKTSFTHKNQKNKTLPSEAILSKHQKNNEVVFKGKDQQKQRLRALLFHKYYKTIIALNHLNQYKQFAKTPFVNNQLADIIFFINPEKNQNLVNQANSLKIPTVGIVSGNMTSVQGYQGYNDFRLKESVYYPILGNPASSFFTRAIISLIVKFLRAEKSKNGVN